MSTNKDHGGDRGGGPPAELHAAQLPADFEAKSRERYAKLASREVTFPEHLKHEQNAFRQQAAVAANPAGAYTPAAGSNSPCGNGDFESGLDPAEWRGAYGSTTPGSGYNGINFAALTAGIVPGAITSAQTHQTWVGAGSDPNVAALSTTAQGTAGAVRIGNAVNGYGCELLSKTFVVTPAQAVVTFWYAVVLQDPGHTPTSCQPFFWVRVTDAAGAIVPNAFDFGGGTDKLVADSANPFFQKLNHPAHGPLVYRDWSCAQIDLSSQVGRQVTIEFVTGDCGYGGHWGYAYIDSFCGNCKGSPAGNLVYNCEASTHCGAGQICFDYSLPQAGKTTGSVTITLGIYQNGSQVAQLSSGVLTSGTAYCFAVDPASIPGLNPALGGFDFAATGAFAIGSTPLGSIKAGTAPDGSISGANNDYTVACRSCAEIGAEQNAYLRRRCRTRANLLPRASCHCPDAAVSPGDCHCDCKAVRLPEIKPCISVSWGDSACDCMETNDVEVLCVTVCNCYSNITFNDLSIGRIRVTDAAGNPVASLPDGTPSVQVIPSGPVCFGDVGPCKEKNQPGCVSRELVLYTRGAVGKDYRLSFEGVCFSVSHHLRSEQCFIMTLCRD